MALETASAGPRLREGFLTKLATACINENSPHSQLYHNDFLFLLILAVLKDDVGMVVFLNFGARKFSSIRIWGRFDMSMVIFQIFTELYKSPFHNPFEKFDTSFKKALRDWFIDGFIALKSYSNADGEIDPTKIRLGMLQKSFPAERTSEKLRENFRDLC